MIRNDEIPSLAMVITSDLDLRDLYRNQFLTAIEDVTAEVAFQVNLREDEMDVTDSIDLTNQAYDASQKWFELIPRSDIQKALLHVLE